VSKETVTRITDRVMDGMTAWQNRPLDRVYPVVFIDAIVVKIREGQVANRPIYVAIGVTVDGERDILGLWAGEGGEGCGTATCSWGRKGRAGWGYGPCSKVRAFCGRSLYC
jgi:transposase-like protein